MQNYIIVHLKLYEGLFSIYKLGSTEIFRLKKFNALHYSYMGT